MCCQMIRPWIRALVLAVSVPSIPSVSCAAASEWPPQVSIEVSSQEALTAQPSPHAVSLIAPVGAPVVFKAKVDAEVAGLDWTAEFAPADGSASARPFPLPEGADNSPCFVAQFSTAGFYKLTLQAKTTDRRSASSSVEVLVVEANAVGADGTYDPPPPPDGGGGPLPPAFQPPKVHTPDLEAASVAIDAPKVLVVNKDDDSQNEFWDINDPETPVPEEDDLVRVTLVASGGADGGKVVLSVEDKNSCLGGDLWRDAKKKEELPADKREWTVSPGSLLAVSFFVEGHQPCGVTDEVKLHVTLTPSTTSPFSPPTIVADTHGLTVYEVDLDIDSDNQNAFGFDFAEDEDQIEDSTSQKRAICTDLVGTGGVRYGKLVFESGFQDLDGDGIPDFADAFGLAGPWPAWTEPDPATVSDEVKFVPVEIKIPTVYDPEKVVVTITCDVDQSVPRVGEGLEELKVTEGEVQTTVGYKLKNPGIRLWRRAPAERTGGQDAPAGDYVPLNKPLQWKDICTNVNTDFIARLWLEFVDENPDSSLAGLHHLKVKVEQRDCPTTEDQVTFTLAVARLAVDYNRDGKVAFDASDRPNAKKPFRFWLNDDRDIEHFADANGLTDTRVQDDVNEGPADFMDDKIIYGRDLEDFCRLHVSTVGLGQEFTSDKLQMKLEWTNATEEPVLNAFRSYQTKGNTFYLFINRESQAQIESQDYGTAIGRAARHFPLQLPTAAWSESGGSWAKACLLFEGASKGKGALRLAVHQGDRRLAPVSGLWLQLCGIKEMYQRWNATEASRPGLDWEAWPRANYQRDGDSPDPDEGVPRSDDEKDFILFVHGWNMDAWDKRTSAETAYKRMWHLGYKGRFGAFLWPTFYSTSLGCLDPRHFDGSEQRAWHSSDALLGLLADLNKQYPGRVHLVAHSMGNVVAAEALRKAPSPVVKNYIASQGALAADVYRLNPDMTWRWPRILQETVPAKLLLKLPPLTPRAVITPNVYAFYPKNGRSDAVRIQQDPKVGEPYMRGAKGAENWFNYFNKNDWALGLWIFNQSQKPNGPDYALLKALLGRTLALEYQSIWDQRFHRSYTYECFPDKRWGFYLRDARNDTNSRNLYTPEDTYEIFSYCAQARCNPTGRQSNLGAPFVDKDGKDRQCDWHEYGSDHPGHSAQFRHTIAMMFPFWKALLTDCKISHIPNQLAP